MLGFQPLLHDLLFAAVAPTQAWSAPDGQVRAEGAQGLYEADVRVLTEAVLTVGGREPEVIGAGAAGCGVVEIVGLARGVDEPGPDPTVRVRRIRRLRPGRIEETLEVAAATVAPVRTRLEMRLACDMAQMEAVKNGQRPDPLSVERIGGRLHWSGAAGGVTIEAPSATADVTDPRAPRLQWTVEVAPGETATVTWAAVTQVAEDAVVLPAEGPAPWSVPTVRCDDPRLPALVARALEDLDALRMRARFAPDEVFLAAGAPWFLTLFGRDSLWAARMMLPLGTELAAGTLRTLAARQGRVIDSATSEEPGKILHEIRSTHLELDGGDRVLPSTYYGTVDATPLWVCLLHDAWRWGMPAGEVEELLPAMEAALNWMAEHADADGDGFLEYSDIAGVGLANQGWKDSGDAIQWRDGHLAIGPVALCEVQAYAYEAAVHGADLLDAFGRPGGDRWRAWAAHLAQWFRSTFWVSDDEGPYPAIALDADKRPVDALTSNIGHLLGTGLLSAEEEAIVARRLASAALDSGYGVRTLSTKDAGYWPLRYHGGSVWAHDTAITVSGLARSGHGDVAAQLAEGFLAAASEFDYRLPELYAGDSRGSTVRVLPYPAACRPQAWSAASAVAVLGALLGLEPDAAAGALRLSPAAPSPVGGLQVDGLRFAGGEVDVRVSASGVVEALDVRAAASASEDATPPHADPRVSH